MRWKKYSSETGHICKVSVVKDGSHCTFQNVGAKVSWKQVRCSHGSGSGCGKRFFTARIRRKGKVMFSVCWPLGGTQSHVLSQVSGPRSFLGGIPVLAGEARQDKGTPSSQETGLGYLLPRSGQDWGTPAPHPGQDWGTPSPRTGLGYPPQPGLEYPSKTEQQSKHLLRGGRYASCIHAGGLSCFNMPLLPRCEHAVPLVGLWKWVSSLVLKVKLTEVALHPGSFVSTSRLLLPPLTVCGRKQERR